MQRLVETCREKGSARSEMAVARAGGERVPLLMVLGNLFDPNRKHVGYTAVVLDITERQRAREELLREKQKLEDVVEVIGAGLALIDRDQIGRAHV